MGFESLSRRQLQSICKKNKIHANITNVAMAHALNSLHFVEGIEEITNPEVPRSPVVSLTGGRTRSTKVVGVLTPSDDQTIATGRRAAAVSTSVRRKIEVSSNKSLDGIEDKKMDVSVKTPASRRRVVRETSTVKHVYNTRRSARLAKKIEETKEGSEAIKIDSFNEDIGEIVEVEMKESSVDQSDISEITVLDNFKKTLTLSEEIEVKNDDESEANSMEKSDITNGRDVAVTSIEQRVVSDIKTDTEMKSNVNEVETMPSTGDESTKASTEEESKAAIEKEFEINSDVEEGAKALFEDSGINCNVDGEAKATNECEINSNVDDETKSSTEKDTEMNFNVDEHDETNAFTEKCTGMNSDEGEDAKASIETAPKLTPMWKSKIRPPLTTRTLE